HSRRVLAGWHGEPGRCGSRAGPSRLVGGRSECNGERPGAAVPGSHRGRPRMRGVATLVGKEVRALFYSPIAYAVIAVFLLLMGYSFTVTLSITKYATLLHIFFQSAGLLMLIVPIITMRLFAEERKAGTLELLLTAPVRESQ